MSQQSEKKTDSCIAVPDIRQLSVDKQKDGNLYEIKCEVKIDNINLVKRQFILSDSPKLASFTIKKIANHRNQLYDRVSKAKKCVRDLLCPIVSLDVKCHTPCYIDNKVFYVDFYIPQTKTVLKVFDKLNDASIHDFKDLEQREYLNKFGIKVIPIFYEEIMSDIMKFYKMLSSLITK